MKFQRHERQILLKVILKSYQKLDVLPFESKSLCMAEIQSIMNVYRNCEISIK